MHPANARDLLLYLLVSRCEMIASATAGDHMLNEDQMETVLVSTSPDPTGHERLVVAFRNGEDLFIPVDSDRPANRELLDADRLYIREVHNQDHYGIYGVESHKPISAADRETLEAYAHQTISVSTEVIHVVGQHLSMARLYAEPPGFVAVIDGSERALQALGPTIELADWYGRPCTIVEVTAGDDDRDTDSAIALQLEGTKLDMHDVVSVTKNDLEARLFELMRQGQILVASAFGVWEADGRLYGMLNGLVRHNAPAIVGVGPNVMPDWSPSTDQPIIVCVDASEHAHHIADKLGPFLVPCRARVIVAHIETETPPDTTIAQAVADEIHRRFGIPVESRTIQEDEGGSAAAAIAILASRMKSQLIITHSWHRPVLGEPPVSSTSLTSVAHAVCPVVILGD